MSKLRRALPFVLLTLGGVAIFIGVNNGDDEIVLKKAISICMECVGIG